MLLHRSSVDHEKDNTAMMGNETGNITSTFIKSLMLELKPTVICRRLAFKWRLNK
jgi:hypothetical protein